MLVAAGVHNELRKTREDVENGTHRATTQRVETLVHAGNGALPNLRDRAEFLVVGGDANAIGLLREAHERGGHGEPMVT